jgi:hypothetical protein
MPVGLRLCLNQSSPLPIADERGGRIALPACVGVAAARRPKVRRLVAEINELLIGRGAIWPGSHAMVGGPGGRA